ncbi:MAG: S46 family peptidase [Phycisphaerae bacterium]|nr:S46 family peptidase [Phycisphaerae bacterium]
MRTALRSLLSVALLGLGISGSFADEGMWLLNAPPAARMKAAHGWAPDEAWLAHAQRSAVRFNTGGSGSLVSGRGLVMTNHHVGRDMLAKLSTPERDFNATGFYAPTLDQELPCPDLELNILWSIEDVTDRVNAGVAPGAEVAAANQQRQATIAEICRAAGEKSGLQPEMVTLWQGGRYHLYLYKRYTDVRIVFAPEEAVAFFGGDTDNFEYPRYCLDVMFFRIYENGKPLANDSYFTWERGSNEGDLALVVGHPGSTSRQLTIDHLASLRDAEVPARLARYWRSEVRSTEFVNRSKEHRRVGADDLFGVANARKAVSGAYLGLLDPAIMGRKAADERALREAVDGNPEWKARFADGWDKVAAAAKARRDLLPLTQALRIRSGLLGRAVTLVQLAEERT